MVSMTGYGIDYGSYGGRRIVCWIKSLNHRLLEIFFDIPPEIVQLEPIMRGEIRRRVKRGRIEVSIKIEGRKFWSSLFPKHYDRHVLNVFHSALRKFDESRQAEGEAIREEISQRISRIKEILAEIQNFHQDFPVKVREILKGRIIEIASEMGLGSVPEDLIDKAGVVHIIRKSDISEEISRVMIHISNFEYEIEREGDGKKLLFILQEIFREFNTMGSKTLDIRVSAKVIEAKLEIERIKEQLNNVE